MKRIVIKWTYLLAVVAFGVWVFNAFFGGHVYLRAEGWCSRNRPSSPPNTRSPFGM